MHEPAPRALVVDGAGAAEAGVAAHPGVHVVPPLRRRQHRLDAEDVIEVLDAAGVGALVLARPPWCEPALAPMPALSIVLGREMLWLPGELPMAAWAVALITAWARSTPSADLSRRAQVAVGLASMAPESLPTREWGPGEARVPAMAGDSLARWCDCAWHSCDWCDAGGIESLPCPACGYRGAPT
jgi:hypothetical protein